MEKPWVTEFPSLRTHDFWNQDIYFPKIQRAEDNIPKVIKRWVISLFESKRIHGTCWIFTCPYFWQSIFLSLPYQALSCKSVVSSQSYEKWQEESQWTSSSNSCCESIVWREEYVIPNNYPISSPLSCWRSVFVLDFPRPRPLLLCWKTPGRELL